MLMSPRGTLPLPAKASDWVGIRRQALELLYLPTFNGESSFELVHAWSGTRDYRGQIDGMDVWLAVQMRENPDAKLIISIANEEENWRQAMFRTVISAPEAICAAFEPRIAGGNLPAEKHDDFPPGSRIPAPRSMHLQAMAIVGLSPVVMTIEDLRVLLDRLGAWEEFKGREIYLHGRGGGGIAALSQDSSTHALPASLPKIFPARICTVHRSRACFDPSTSRKQSD